MSPGGPRPGATEFAHIHTQYYAPDSEFAQAQGTRPWQAWQGGGQGSMHLCLTLQDTATVLENGCMTVFYRMLAWRNSPAHAYCR